MKSLNAIFFPYVNLVCVEILRCVNNNLWIIRVYCASRKLHLWSQFVADQYTKYGATYSNTAFICHVFLCAYWWVQWLYDVLCCDFCYTCWKSDIAVKETDGNEDVYVIIFIQQCVVALWPASTLFWYVLTWFNNSVLVRTFRFLDRNITMCKWKRTSFFFISDDRCCRLDAMPSDE